MLYDEFLEGTGCRDTEYNYKIYKQIEIVYMNTDDEFSKDDFYAWGKKLVDNTLTESERILFDGRMAEIADLKKDMKEAKEQVKFWTHESKTALTKRDKYLYLTYAEDSKETVESCKAQIDELEAEIAGLKEWA